MARIDGWTTRLARELARRTSRRGLLASAGAILVGTAAIPLLPIARAGQRAAAPRPGEPDPSDASGDAEDCRYWRYCGIDGFLASHEEAVARLQRFLRSLGIEGVTDLSQLTVALRQVRALVG